MVTAKGHNRLSFVIVVKGGEYLGVSVNEKGGDCWQCGIWLSLMQKDLSNDKGITKDMIWQYMMTWHE